MNKRSASSDLNRDNWKDDDEPEELGVFKQASDEVLKGREIRKAKRRETRNEPLKPVFNNFTAFKANPISAPDFSFGLPKLPQFPSLTNKQEGTQISVGDNKSKIDKSSSKCEEAEDIKCVKSTESSMSKSQLAPSISQNVKAGKIPELKFDSKCKDTIENSNFSSKTSSETSKNKNKYFANLKALNVNVLKWIQQHVEKNPYISLMPIFDDYKKFLFDLKEKHKGDINMALQQIPTIGEGMSSKVSTVSPLNVEKKSVPTFNFGTSNSVGSESTFSFGIKAQPSFSFNFPCVNKTETTKTPDSVQEQSSIKDEEPSDEVPPTVAIDVKEEGSVYDKRVKLFYKKDGNYVEKGLGTLFLKPAGEKTQLIVRALNSLGCILLNIVLNSSIPSQRLGKNNVLLMCIPNPPLDPSATSSTPISMLIRVKTSQEADELLEKIEEHKK